METLISNSKLEKINFQISYKREDKKAREDKKECKVTLAMIIAEANTKYTFAEVKSAN